MGVRAARPVTNGEDPILVVRPFHSSQSPGRSATGAAWPEWRLVVVAAKSNRSNPFHNEEGLGEAALDTGVTMRKRPQPILRGDARGHLARKRDVKVECHLFDKGTPF